MYKNLFKRIFDIFSSIVFISLFWWVYIIVALLVKKN